MTTDRSGRLGGGLSPGNVQADDVGGVGPVPEKGGEGDAQVSGGQGDVGFRSVPVTKVSPNK